MPVINETQLGATWLIDGNELPVGQQVNSFEANIPVNQESYEALSKLFAVEMTTSIGPMEGSITWASMPDVLSSITRDWRTVHHLILTGNVVTETSKSTTDKIVKRVFDLWFTFKDELPLGSREHGTPAEYESTLNIRSIISYDDGVERFAFNPYEEISRIDGVDVVLPLK
jgi:hypothetical protein